MVDASGQTLKPLRRLPVTILVNLKSTSFPFLLSKTLSVPRILGWDYQKQYVKPILPWVGKVRWNNGQDSVVPELLDFKYKQARTGRPRVSRTTLNLNMPVYLAPRSETTVLVTTRATGQCVVTGHKELLANG